MVVLPMVGSQTSKARLKRTLHLLVHVHDSAATPRACFSNFPELFGSISKPSNFTMLLIFLTLKTYLKNQLFKTSALQFDNWLFGPEKLPGLSRNRPQL